MHFAQLLTSLLKIFCCTQPAPRILSNFPDTKSDQQYVIIFTELSYNERTLASIFIIQVCYWSYLSRTCLEIVLSIGLFLIYFCWGMPNLEREINCDVHGIRHSCVLPNHQVCIQGPPQQSVKSYLA